MPTCLPALTEQVKGNNCVVVSLENKFIFQTLSQIFTSREQCGGGGKKVYPPRYVFRTLTQLCLTQQQS